MAGQIRVPDLLGPEALGRPHDLLPATRWPHDLLPATRWRHEWKDLVRHHPLTAAKTMALHGHGIAPQLVDHIEDEKDADTATLTRYLTR